MLEWSDVDIAVRDAVREFIDKEIRPHLDDLEDGELEPYPIVRKLFATFGIDVMAKESLERNAREQGIWATHVWGERIEDRGSQITFSALGQLAPVEAKEAWDPTNEKKNRLACAVAAELPNLEVRPGGSSSVDISQRGVDKSFAVRELADILDIEVGQIVFIGDRMEPDGNDYPAAKAGTRAVKVNGPADTVKLCGEIIARLSR